ncbi:MAG: YecA family protein [Chlorobi bacterium]|nr:YecA family protein [Chlorobiota bacterium]
MNLSDDLMLPLSSEELDELEDFLLSDTHDDKSMTLDMLDGFLASLAVGPSLVMPDEWLPMVMDVEGGGAFSFASPEEASRITSLVIRYMNSVVSVFDDDPDGYEPLFDRCMFDDPEEEALAVKAWSLGFIIGMELRWDEWLPVFGSDEKEENAEQLLLAPVFLLSGTDENMPELNDEEREAWRDMIPESVAGLYRYWQPSRGEMPQ